ncbi:MAG: NAD(P)/FAD-dependent oxidoreductase [Chloroflexota bacterium]
MRSLWADPDARRYSPLERDREIDIAIVGGGLSGVGAALALLDSGAEVALLEGRAVASGASGRNAGFVLAGPAQSYGETISRIGHDAALDVWHFTVENNRRIGDLVQEHDIGCGYLRHGSISLAAGDAEWETLRAEVQRLLVDGIACCLVERAALPRPFDQLYCGGLYFAGNAEIDPGRFSRAIAALVDDRITLHEGSPVESLRHDGIWRLETNRATLSARQVLLCTNAYTARLLPDVPILPRRGQVLATVPIDRALVPFPMYANNGYQYWRQTEDGRLIVGGWRNLDPESEVGEQESLHGDIQATLLAFASTIMGIEAGVEYRWAGIMGFTQDMTPLVGAVPDCPGLFLAAGYSDHGVAMAVSCGAHIAGLAAGAHPIVPPCFDPARFGPPAFTLPA